MTASTDFALSTGTRNLRLAQILSRDLSAGTQSNRPGRTIYCIEPLTDPRWDGLLEKHPSASVFHSKAWLEALRRTYGYESIAYTTSAPEEPLRNGIAFCQVESWLTGRRLVSLPFSDYCEPLLERTEEIELFVQKLQQESDTGRWRYIEMRPLETFGMENRLWHATAKYALHRLDLRPDLQTLFKGFHKDSIQRKINRAKREGLTCQVGTSEAISTSFMNIDRYAPPAWSTAATEDLVSKSARMFWTGATDQHCVEGAQARRRDAHASL